MSLLPTHTLVTENLNLRRVCSRWVPRQLIPEQQDTGRNAGASALQPTKTTLRSITNILRKSKVPQPRACRVSTARSGCVVGGQQIKCGIRLFSTQAECTQVHVIVSYNDPCPGGTACLLVLAQVAGIIAGLDVVDGIQDNIRGIQREQN
ncbi:hypothetical protein C0J52_23554 [Blattella germanica]|nr:hypothetical protein C0J52_23554 [Blattella germanica]